jgi:hypothetical protein
MTVMACDKCDSVFVIEKDSALKPCPRCCGKTRWATREEVTEHLRRGRRRDGCDHVHIPVPAVAEELKVICVIACQAAKRACEESRQTRDRSRKMREQRKG